MDARRLDEALDALAGRPYYLSLDLDVPSEAAIGSRVYPRSAQGWSGTSCCRSWTPRSAAWMSWAATSSSTTDSR